MLFGDVMEEKKVKRKLNKKAILVILLTLYLIIMAFYYCFTLPIKNIIIKGNNLVSDSEIITAAGIENYPSIFRTNSKNIVKKVTNLDLITDASVKKNINGTITITVTEPRPLFYNALNNKIALADGSEAEMPNSLLGLPTLINYVPSDIYENLINKLSTIDSDIVSLISEIEYSPDVKNDVTINDSRFILKMNDGNLVYIDLVNFANLNRYKVIYSNLDEKGILHLDGVYSGSDSDTIIFTSFAALENKENSEAGEENELSE